MLGIAGDNMLLLRSTIRGSEPLFDFNPDPGASSGHAASSVLVGEKTACVLLPFVSTAAERSGERLNCVLDALDDADLAQVHVPDDPGAVRSLQVGRRASPTPCQICAAPHAALHSHKIIDRLLLLCHHRQPHMPHAGPRCI